MASLAKTHRLVVVHEANRRSGIGGEIVSQIIERASTSSTRHRVIVAGLDVPMPYNKRLEALVIPNEARIRDGILAAAGPLSDRRQGNSWQRCSRCRSSA